MFTPSWIRRLFTRTTQTIRRAPVRRRCRPSLEALEDRIMLSVFTVTKLTDTALPTGNGVGGPNGGSGDLRFCINQANSNNQANTIQFDSTVFATAQTITLGGFLFLSDTSGKQTITGPSAGVTIHAPQNKDILEVYPGVTASLSGLTFTGGFVGSGGPFDGGGTPVGNGGAISNGGNLTLQNCQITANFAGDKGGGVHNSGTLTLNTCTVSGNEATRGAGIYNSGVLRLDSTTLSNNFALYGGAVVNEKGTASATLTNCTVSGNKAGLGGAFYNVESAQLTLSGCNLSGDTASVNGGGVLNKGTLHLTNCTFDGESGQNGGGLYNSGTATISDQTTIKNNHAFYATKPSNGGGIFNTGFITVTDSKVTGNKVSNNGGGICNYGTMAMTDSTVSGNLAEINGGGIEDSTGALTITNCKVSLNQAFTDGGGINGFSRSSAMRDCTISGNRARSGGGMASVYGDILNSTFAKNHASANGGAIFLGGTLTNCTIYNNTAYQVTKQLDGSFTYSLGQGGGIWDSAGFGGGTPVLTNCTIFKNEVSRFAKGSFTGYNGGQGGDIYNFQEAFTLNNCLVAGSTDFGGAIAGTVSGNNNLVDEQGALAKITGNNNSYSTFGALDLAVIHFNGGTTQTVAPDSPLSTLLGNGDPSLIPAGVTTDQRGASRTRNGKVDIGAVESNANIIVTTLVDEDNGGPDPVLGTGTSLREAINFANLDPSENDTITFAPGLTGTLDLTLGALPTLTAGMTIDGPGANVLTIDALGPTTSFRSLPGLAPP